ncbi:MAG: hypothetical protein Q9194_004601 [Teloschistes cf. exilis]
MFGTLHLNSQTKEAEFIERPHGASDPEKNSACNRCRAKKPSVNAAQQEPSLDLLIQSWDSSSTKVSGTKGSVCSDKRTPSSSLPADGKNDREHGQEVLVNPTTDKSADIPPNFDMSFLAEFGQAASGPDGDKTCNLTLSPWPFFPTSLPNTHPEPLQLPPARAPENPLSPSLSADDDLPHYLPPSTQPQDSLLFEFGPYTASVSSRASPLLSTVAGQSCHCLAAVVFAVEEFEATCNLENRAELDSIIALQKQAVKRCRSMLQCGGCVVKRENIVLLVFMTEKIVVACERVVGLYRMRDGETQAGSVPCSPLGCLPTGDLWQCVNMEDRGSATSASSPSSKTDCTHSGSVMSMRIGTCSHWQEVLSGDYEISSPLEWDHLVRVLIHLQLRAVMELLADVKDMGSKLLGEMQAACLAQAEIRISELEKDMYMI